MMSATPSPHPSKKPVIERKKRSCGECRRRKQKCDQRRPCRNCSRRMPQPVCRYEGSPLRESSAPELLPRLPLAPAPDSTSPVSSTSTALSALTLSVLDPDAAEHWTPSPSTTTSVNDVAFDEACRVWGITDQDLLSSPYPTQQNTVPLYTDGFLPSLSADRAHAHPSLFADTCRVNAKTIVNRDAILTARCSAIQDLHAMLAQPEMCISDDAIAAVLRLVMSDLCAGETQELGVHMDGIREMARLRGGLTALGMDGNLARMALIADLLAAITLETTPSFPDADLTAYTSTLTNTSTLSTISTTTTTTTTAPQPPTTNPTNPTGPTPTLDPTTAAMLKDVDFLLDTVLALPPAPSAWQLQKVQTMSEWVQGRLSSVAESGGRGKGKTKDHSDADAESALHRAVRLAAVVYCRAVRARQPFSTVVREGEVGEVVEAVGEVAEAAAAAAAGGGGWEGMEMEGVLVKVLAVVLPGGGRVEECCGVRMMMVTAAVRVGMRDWAEVVGVLGRVVKVQRWLCGVAQG